VNSHIEQRQGHLARCENPGVDILRGDETVNEAIRYVARRQVDLCAALVLSPRLFALARQMRVVAAQPLQSLGCPAPILEELARSLDEVFHRAVAMKRDVLGSSEKVMNACGTDSMSVNYFTYLERRQ